MELFEELEYKAKVKNSLLDIIMSVNGISEKSFGSLRVLSDDLSIFFKDSSVLEIVNRFELDGLRPEFCAELLYSRLEKVN